jgi:hypothetical protein
MEVPLPGERSGKRSGTKFYTARSGVGDRSDFIRHLQTEDVVLELRRIHVAAENVSRFPEEGL